MGIPPEMLAQMLADATPDEAEADDAGTIEILPPNRDAVRVFFAMATQWRSVAVVAGPHAMIVKTALDYGALTAVAAALNVALNEDLLDRLQTLEGEAAAALAEARR